MSPNTRIPFRLANACRHLLIVACGLLSTVSFAAGIGFAVDRVDGDGWHVAGFSVALQSPYPGVVEARASIAELALPDDQGTLNGLVLDCALTTSADGWACNDGHLRVAGSPVGAQEAGWQGRYVNTQQWRLELADLQLGAGAFTLDLSSTGGELSAALRGHRLPLRRLVDLSGATLLPGSWGLKGHLSGSLTAGRKADGRLDAHADLVVDQISYASPDGSQAAENLLLKLDGSVARRGSAWYVDASLRSPRGAVYTDPVFVDTGERALVVAANGDWQSDQETLTLQNGSVDLAGVVNLSATGRLRSADVAPQDLTVAVRSDDLDPLYRTLLQPFLIGTAADDLETAGRLGMVLHFDSDGIEQAGLDVTGLAFDDRQGRFSLGPTQGSVAWDRDDAVPVSRVEIRDASVYRIPTGAFSINARFSGDRVTLTEPVVVPVLGGRLALDSFVLSGALVAGDTPHWRASASVDGVSLERLTEALAWPPFEGEVSGGLTDMHYQDGVFSIGGRLQLEAFGGEIRVRDLTIRDPLGRVPILGANARIRNIDLESLTRTFAFGRIEGRLDGDAKDIRLVAWRPDRFDLHLYTPDDDHSRHRISQRAVENLTELGSGVPAGLSTTFLQIFNDFGYDRIAVKILLQGNVAELDGLARDAGGYYLVRGAGLPRIDVIGRNRSVAWKDLVERLTQIQVEGARIQ